LAHCQQFLVCHHHLHKPRYAAGCGKVSGFGEENRPSLQKLRLLELGA
jgi:hypothetical protein